MTTWSIRIDFIKQHLKSVNDRHLNLTDRYNLKTLLLKALFKMEGNALTLE